MTRRPDPTPAADLDAALARLGVRELEERMELSPLLTGADVQDSDACRCECVCDDTPEDPNDPLFLDRLSNTRINDMLA